MADVKEGGSEIIKSEDPGETIEEAGLDGDAEGADDGVETKADSETGETEPDEAGDEGDDAGREGAETDRDRGSDVEKGPAEGEPTELDAFRELLKQKDAELAKFKEMAQKPQKEAPAPISEEQWSAVEERFGGLSRTQIQPLAELVERGAKAVESRIAARLATVEKELLIARLAESDGTRDIRANRAGVEEFLKTFAPETHADERLLKMALVYARGAKAGQGQKTGAAKERGLRVVGAGKPNTGGASAGGAARGVKLTNQERQAAKLGGMSEREYYGMKYGGRK